MNKLFILFSFIPFQHNVPPGVVLDVFKQRFPFASQIKWTKENAHEYEAEFKINSVPCSANFTDKGIWLETETPIGHFKIPELLKSSIQNEKIKQIYKIEKADGTINFEVEILKGTKTVERFFDQDGHLIKS